MSVQLQDVRLDFQWQPQPAAAELVGSLLSQFIQANPQIRTLAQRVSSETGTRLVDWIDSIAVASDAAFAGRLEETGYAADRDDARIWRHPDGIFPVIRLVDQRAAANHKDRELVSLAIKVGSIDDFAAAMAPAGEARMEGPAGSQYRTCTLPCETGPVIVAVERHGWPGFVPPANRAQQITAAAKHWQAFAVRRRAGQADADGFRLAARLFEAAAADLGRDWACDLFFAAERSYWMSRNAAARVQFQRQQRLGLGWGNHDHHTYRSSRGCFSLLIGNLEAMGFQCRERFYAGREAGWGAQVLEQPACGIVIFADVDLTAEEVAGDFAHGSLPSQQKLGTVGLWCKLHGEAFLQAGMHHLESQFDFDAVRPQLAVLGVETMVPFTEWPHLKQAFTKGEIWPVESARIDVALSEGCIAAEQAEQFRREGAIGSHLEILERNDGFKGFNQTGISEIIARTDPRKQYR